MSVDKFVVWSPTVATEMLAAANDLPRGHGAFNVRGDDKALLLAPPISFRLRTDKRKRVERHKLKVRGHMVVLELNQTTDAYEMSLDHDGYEYDEDDEDKYWSALAVAVDGAARGGVAVPRRMRAWAKRVL